MKKLRLTQDLTTSLLYHSNVLLRPPRRMGCLSRQHQTRPDRPNLRLLWNNHPLYCRPLPRPTSCSRTPPQTRLVTSLHYRLPTASRRRNSHHRHPRYHCRASNELHPQPKYPTYRRRHSNLRRDSIHGLCFPPLSHLHVDRNPTTKDLPR